MRADQRQGRNSGGVDHDPPYHENR
jgi:hypothetical protein